MPRDHFIRKFGKQGKYSTVPVDMIHEAFDELDQDRDGAPPADISTYPPSKASPIVRDRVMSLYMRVRLHHN